MDPEHYPQLYVRIRAHLGRKIRKGQYPARSKLPTEAGLAAEYGCGPGQPSERSTSSKWSSRLVLGVCQGGAMCPLPHTPG